jgi:hypothetical protein
MGYGGEKAKITLGEYGLLADISPDKIPPGALIQANNVCFFNGNVQKAPGTVKWNEIALPAGVVAIYDWNPTTVVQRMVAVTSEGNIYKGQDRQFGSAINSSIASVLTPNCMFAEGGAETAGRDKKLFFFTDGATNPYVMSGDGTAFTTLSQPAADWTSTGTYPRFGVVHRNRLWAFAGQIGYASDTGDHENFVTASLTDPIYPGEGGELRGAAVFKGRLMAFKDGGFVYMLNDQSATEAEWYWQKLGSNFGLCAPNAVSEVLNDLYAGNTTGTINSYGATEKLGSVEAGDIIQELQFETFLRGNTSKVGIQYQHMHYYGEKKLLLATYRSTYDTANDMLLTFDFSNPNRIRPSFWIKGSPQCLAKYKDVNQVLRPMYGDADGYIHLMDREDRSEGGTAYTGSFQTPHLDMSHLGPQFSSAEKQFDFLAVHYIPESTGDLSADVYIDGRFYETLTFPMIQYTRPSTGTLTLNTDRLAPGGPETCIRALHGTGRTISFYFYNSGNNQSFQVPAYTVYFRGGGDKAQQV